MNELFFITLLAIVAIVFGYTFSLERRTLKLEQKNGNEQKQIDELKHKIAELERENTELRQELALLKVQLTNRPRKKDK